LRSGKFWRRATPLGGVAHGLVGAQISAAESRRSPASGFPPSPGGLTAGQLKAWRRMPPLQWFGVWIRRSAHWVAPGSRRSVRRAPGLRGPGSRAVSRSRTHPAAALAPLRSSRTAQWASAAGRPRQVHPPGPPPAPLGRLAGPRAFQGARCLVTARGWNRLRGVSPAPGAVRCPLPWGVAPSCRLGLSARPNAWCGRSGLGRVGLIASGSQRNPVDGGLFQAA